jgi:hypothetical protein
MLLVLVWLQPWKYPMHGIFTGGGDTLWVQATAEAHSRSGPIGRDLHSAWPEGYAPWSFPQLGMLFAVLCWMLGTVLGLPSALIVWLVLIAVAAVCSVCTLYFFRSLVGDFASTACISMSCALGASPFVLGKVPHLSVASFFLLPLAIGAAITSCRGDRRGLLVAVPVCAAGAIMSPLWWVVVATMVLGVSLVPVIFRRSWLQIRGRSAVIGGLLVGLGFQSVLYHVYRVPGALDTRGPWDSNIHGGHLSDLLVSSPLLNEAFPRLQTLGPGSSVEPSSVGLFAGAGALAAVLLVIVGLPRRKIGGHNTSVLADTTVVALLLFLLGGLGNLQAAVAVFFGATSPARVWSRLTILLALLGLGWLLVLFSAWAQRFCSGTTARRGIPTRVGALVAIVAALSWVGDAWQTPKILPAARESWPEYAAVRYLETTVNPCPVAQLPQDGFPQPRFGGPLPSDVEAFYYRGFIPYLLSPAFSWSFGSWVPGQPKDLNKVPVRVEPRNLSELGKAGYCAVLFDKQLAGAAKSLAVPLEGVEITGTEPDFASQRFDVYLLR